MSGANSWLQRQRKSDLVEIAQNVGLKEYVQPNNPQPLPPILTTVFALPNSSQIFAKSSIFYFFFCLECPTFLPPVGVVPVVGTRAATRKPANRTRARNHNHLHPHPFI